MQVTLSALCDFVSETSNRKLNLLGIFKEVTAKGFPSRMANLYAVVQIDLTDAETQTGLAFAVRILDPHKKVLMEGGAMKLDKRKPGETGSITMTIHFQNLEIGEEGLYTVEFVSNKKVFHELTFISKKEA